MVEVSIQDTPVEMEVDTGATLSIMSHATYLSTWSSDTAPALTSTQAKLRTYTGEQITVMGAIEVPVKYGDQAADLQLVIVEGEGPTLTGRDWLRHLRLDWARLNNITPDHRSELNELLHAHSGLFSSDLGQIKGTTAHLHLKPGAKPRFHVHDKYHMHIERDLGRRLTDKWH